MQMLKRWRKRLRALVSTEAVNRELDEELAFHIDMETEKYMRAGMDPDEARRKAKHAFGATRHYMAETRNARWLWWLPGFVLDFKLGGRMLRKYPGLTIVGGLAMAFGIWFGTLTFEMVRLVVNPTIPLPEGDRIVQLRLWDTETNHAEPRALHDYMVWRQSVRSVEDLGAFADATRNVFADDGEARPVATAEITAAGFRIAPVTPLIGRTLTEADEAPGAPAVAVLGYGLWRNRFSSHADIVGRTIRIGDGFATVVGVMPEGFAFPVAHELWLPFRPGVADQTPREGPPITIFARLAPGVSIDAARAELVSLGKREAAELPATHAHLIPQIKPYAQLGMEVGPQDMWLMRSIPMFALLLLGLVCSNVALLMFARAATRESELVVRSALGASRRRIVAQLFAEALVLGGVAAVIGLIGAKFAIDQWGKRYLAENMGTLPFWYDPHLSTTTVLYALGLMVLGAAIAGVLPGMKATKGLGTRLRNGSAGAGLRFGGVWTVVIIAQVAVTAAFPAATFILQRELWRAEAYDVGFHADQYLGVAVALDVATGSRASAANADSVRNVRYANALEEMRRRLLNEPGVTGVTFVDRLPRSEHHERLIEVENDSRITPPSDAARVPVPRDSLAWVTTATIDQGYFDVLDAPLLAGREFNSGDVSSDAPALIVDEVFVKRVLRGRSAIGQRVRFVPSASTKAKPPEEPGPWYQIVGVAKDLGLTAITHRDRDPGVYLPADLRKDGPMYMAVHVMGDPLSFVPRVRALGSAVDPALRLSELQRLNEVYSGVLWFLRLWIRITLGLTAMALLLSLAGIYAVMSFTVARRTREIGIRVALGANARTMVTQIFRRPVTQVSIGVLLGSILAGLLMLTEMGGGKISVMGVGLMALYGTLILAVCLLACVVPTRRALSVQPMEALRVE